MVILCYSNCMQENNTTTNNDEVVTTDVEAGTQHIDSVVSTEITGAVTSEPVTREVSEDK